MKNRKFVMGIAFGTILSILAVNGIYSITRNGSIQAAMEQQSDVFEEPEQEISYQKEKLTILDTVINQFYIETEEAFDLVEGIYAGYVYGLEDPYTRYLTEEEFKKTTAQEKGNDMGVGIQFTWGINNQHLMVTNVIPHSPADEAGMVVGDKIIEIDGIRAMASNEVQIYDKLTYAGEEKVEYVVVDNDEQNERTLQLLPEEIEIENVESEYLEGNIAYISLQRVVEGTAQRVEEELKKLEEQGATKIILDLRGTYSNDIEEAVKLADLFLEEQTLCWVQDKEATVPYMTTSGSKSEPLAILINSGTSGAVEATVKGLQLAERAIIVGQESEGRGTLQKHIELEDGSGLDIAAALILDAKGAEIRDNPIEPDVTQHIAMDNTLELVTTGKLSKNDDVIIKKAIESLQ